MQISGGVTRKEFVHIIIGRTFEHFNRKEGFYCPLTGKTVKRVFGDHSRPGFFNACPRCHWDQRTSAQKLHDLHEQRKQEKIDG